jgi:hypothetical protein
MADIPLNAFKTVTAVLTQDVTDVYLAPPGVSSIVLMAQIANIGDTSANATVIHNKGFVNTELISEFSIPANDSASAITGKLVLESGAKLKAAANVNNQLKLTLSILESANE